MSGEDDLSDLLGPEPLSADTPIEEPVAIASRPMGEASRALLERSRSYPVQRAAKKNTPRNLTRLLSYAAEMPVGADAARRCGISYSTLKYWLQKSLEGAPGDGFDMTLGENDENGTDNNTIRFHEAWDVAMDAGVAKTERATIQRATGYWEPLTYQGKVIYKQNPDLLELGFDGPQAYLLDEFGAPVPESVWKMDPDLAMFILKTRLPKTYGAKASLDINVKGGVLVVPMRTIVAADLNEIESNYRKEGRPQITFEEGDEEAVDAE